MSNINDDPLYSKNVLEMITVANEFCLFLEEAEKYEKSFFLSYFQKVCPLLYLKGSLLPVITVSDENANERFVNEEQWEIIFQSVKNILKEDDEYWHSKSVSKTELEPLKGSIAENLADIYQDMKDFIFLYQKNSRAAKENAVQECKRLFESHWGYICIQIQKTIHHLLYKEKMTDETPDIF